MNNYLNYSYIPRTAHQIIRPALQTEIISNRVSGIQHLQYFCQGLFVPGVQFIYLLIN